MNDDEAGAGNRTDADPGTPGKQMNRPLPSGAMPESVPCPFCDGSETEQFSAFGSAVSVGQYYCRDCKTVFEWMKWR